MNLEFLIIRTIFENPNISQRGLAKKFFVSLGKINSVLSSTIDNGLIIKGKNETLYSVTAKGRKELENHKVDGAIILACGNGLRVSPIDRDLPVCFLKVNGETLIERQIKQLNEVGIYDITIMVGYMKEKFDYLIDKFNVKLIYNEEYKYKNTLATLYHAKDVIRNKNVYVCVSDVYMSENIYHQYEVEPYYTGVFFEDCKNDWRFITNSKNEIKDIAVGGANDFCFAGHAFFTKEFSNEFLPMIEEYYNESYADAYYWEDVLVKNLKKLPKIYLYKIEDGIINEFDNLNDINKFDKQNQVAITNLKQFISKSLNVDENVIKDLNCIEDGVANRLYEFDCEKLKYMIKIPSSNANELIDRKNEKEILEKLQKLNITETLCYYDSTNGYKISKFIEKEREFDVTSEDDLKKCMKLYKTLHLSDIKVKSSCDLIDKIGEYLNIIKEKNIYVPYEDFEDTVKKAKNVMNDLKKYKRIKTICHGDATPRNIFITRDGFKLLNFEYSGMSDPISDIALFAISANFDQDKAYKIYEYYKVIDIGKDDTKIIIKDEKSSKKLLTSYMALAGFYNAIWSIVRGGTTGADYGNLGMNGYRVFKNILFST